MTNSTYERYKELQASGNLKNRLAKMLQSDMTNQAPDITLAPGSINYMRPSETVVDHVYHDAYMVNVGQPVYVANNKMVLKKHTTKTMTVFTREQLVIGERMKHWMPFEFSGVSATPTELFDLGYYVFETENKKWPHMIVEKSLFEDQLAMDPSLEAIKKGLSRLWIDEAKTEADAKAVVREKEKEAQEEENARLIEDMRKHLGFVPVEEQAVEYFKAIAEVCPINPDKEPDVLKVCPINPDDLGPVIPPVSPLTKKQERQ